MVIVYYGKPVDTPLIGKLVVGYYSKPVETHSLYMIGVVFGETSQVDMVIGYYGKPVDTPFI